MKNFFKLFLIFASLPYINIFAMEEINIDYKLENSEYVLIVSDNNNIIYDYKDAVDKFNIEEYVRINIDGEYHYFYFGKEIEKKEYDSGVQIYELMQNCEGVHAECIIVNSTDDLINKVDDIYASRKPDLFYLLYSSSNYRNMDFDKFNSYFEKKFMVNIEQNMYSYSDYYFVPPEKKLPYHDENMIIINTRNIKTNEEETTKVDAFLDVFLKEFEGKSDYEKIMGVYTYINNTAIYQTDAGYINFMDGQLSAYDVLIKHKAVCIGLATTFQLMMERLGIDSYIVDHVSSKSDTEYVTTHTYNIVKLDNEWYIVDIPLDGSLNGLLKGISENYSLEDFKYYDIKIANENYLDTHKNLSKDFSFDYASLLDLTKDIDNNKREDVKDKKESTKKSYTLEYILIVGILIIILGVIYIFTRKR